jgi:hypothetical protein
MGRKPVYLSVVQANLGDPRLIFTPDPLRIWIGVCASVVVWAIGLAFVHRAFVADDKWINIFGSVAFPLVGSGMLHWLISISGLKIFLYPEGLVLARRRQVAVFLPWEHIARIEERRNGTVIIGRHDGEAIFYNQDTIKHAALLTKLIRAAIVGISPDKLYRFPSGHTGDIQDFQA